MPRHNAHRTGWTPSACPHPDTALGCHGVHANGRWHTYCCCAGRAACASALRVRIWRDKRLGSGTYAEVHATAMAPASASQSGKDRHATVGGWPLRGCFRTGHPDPARARAPHGGGVNAVKCSANRVGSVRAAPMVRTGRALARACQPEPEPEVASATRCRTPMPVRSMPATIVVADLLWAEPGTQRITL